MDRSSIGFISQGTSPVILGAAFSCFGDCATDRGCTINSTGAGLSYGLKPKRLPSLPPGFGTGHSLGLVEDASDNIVLSSPSSCFAMFPDCGCDCFSRGIFFFSRDVAESANRLWSTGQGRMCGKETTRKDTASVVVNSVDVDRERGCR